MKYYFREDQEHCHSLDFLIDNMKDKGLDTMELTEGQRDYRSDYFYCRHYSLVGEKGDCGKDCKIYKPRNGRNGICMEHRPTYTSDGKKFTLKKQGDKYILTEIKP